jgi:DNA-binding LytR/AlgR family response regulator
MKRAPGRPKDIESDGDESICVRTAGGSIVRLAWSEVSWIEIEGRFLRLHTTTGDSYRWQGTLKSLEQRWGKYGHMRVDKALMVYTPRVEELRKRSDGYAVYLGDGAGGGEFPISRRKAQEIKQILATRDAH